MWCVDMQRKHLDLLLCKVNPFCKVDEKQEAVILCCELSCLLLLVMVENPAVTPALHPTDIRTHTRAHREQRRIQHKTGEHPHESLLEFSLYETGSIDYCDIGGGGQ